MSEYPKEIRVALQLTNCEIVDASDLKLDAEPFDYFAEPDYGPAPKHGWDNQIDILEFKRRCQDAAH